MMGGPVRVRRAPVGVVAAITPWNVPLFIAALKLGPGLLAGCTFVLKPSPETPLDSYPLAEAIIEAGFPEGVINIIPAGRETGEYLVKHPSIDKVSFTGSTAAGMRIGELCGGQLKRCTLELGGKSAAIVLDDANLDAGDARPARAERRDEQRSGVWRAEPHPRVAQALRRSGRRARQRARRAQGRRPARRRHADRPARGRAAAHARRGLHRRRQGGRRACRHRRRPSGRPAHGLVRRADRVRRRRQLDEDRAGRDLRSGAVGDPVRRRGERGEDRERLRLRPLRLGVDRPIRRAPSRSRRACAPVWSRSTRR